MYFTISNEYGSIDYYNNDEEMVKQRLSNVFFEQEFVVKHLTDFIKKSSVIYDIGAHCGSHSIMYKRINPDATIYAFEPQLNLYWLLSKNIKTNNLKNVFAYNNAVGDFTGNVEMNPFSTDGSNSMERIEYGGDKYFNLAGVQIGSGGEKVKMIKIDDMMIPCCDFMKIDVEGYEPHVLEGAKDTVARCKPTIVYEVNNKKSDRAISTSTEILESYGYLCTQIWSDNWIATPNF